jgi:excisionase family DNA binding protein
MVTGEPLIMVSEAARVARVSPDTIRRWEQSGRLEAIRTSGGIRLFSRADVERVAVERARRRSAVNGVA